MNDKGGRVEERAEDKQNEGKQTERKKEKGKQHIENKQTTAKAFSCKLISLEKVNQYNPHTT